MNRKRFIQDTGLALAGSLLLSGSSDTDIVRKHTSLKMSLSQWALHRMIFGKSKDDYNVWIHLLHTDPDQLWQGPLHPLDFPTKARELGFEAVEYVNSTFYGHATDKKFLSELRSRTDAEGIQNVLLMVDEEGYLGHPDKKDREQAITNHLKWLEAARSLGCEHMRVNAFSMGDAEDQKKYTVEGIRKLAELAEGSGVNILIENHGGMSSNADWLVDVIETANHEQLGIVADLDNFTFSEDFIWGDGKVYNRYIGVEKLLPYARSVSAKSHAFDIQGYETTIDYSRMMKLIKKAEFSDYICVEYEGARLTEIEGIMATKSLIEKTYVG